MTPEQIVAAATHLFAARGVNATSLQEVADAVGIRKQSLLYHFPSKEELRQRVLDQLLSRWSDVLPRLLMAASSGEGQFDAVIAETVGFFAAEPDRARLLLREVLDRPDDVRSMMDSRVQPWVAVVSGYIRKGMERGTTPADTDPEAYVLTVINLILSCVATADCFGGLVEPRRLVAEVLRVAKSSLFIPAPKASLP
jgi:TetR/AcrR family transcriptional regulator